MASRRKYPIKLQGTVDWVYPEETQGAVEVERALFRGEDEIVIECVYGGDRFNARLLRRSVNRFAGDVQSANGGVLGTAACDIYSNNKGYLLFGSWVEKGDEFIWWALLKEVARFDSEHSD